MKAKEKITIQEENETAVECMEAKRKPNPNLPSFTNVSLDDYDDDDDDDGMEELEDNFKDKVYGMARSAISRSAKIAAKAIVAQVKADNNKVLAIAKKMAVSKDFALAWYKEAVASDLMYRKGMGQDLLWTMVEDGLKLDPEDFD